MENVTSEVCQRRTRFSFGSLSAAHNFQSAGGAVVCMRAMTDVLCGVTLTKWHNCSLISRNIYPVREPTLVLNQKKKKLRLNVTDIFPIDALGTFGDWPIKMAAWKIWTLIPGNLEMPRQKTLCNHKEEEGKNASQTSSIGCRLDFFVKLVSLPVGREVNQVVLI